MALDAKIPGDMFNDAYFKSIANNKKFYNICHDCGGKYSKWRFFSDINHAAEKRSCGKCGKTQYRKAELIS